MRRKAATATDRGEARRGRRSGEAEAEARRRAAEAPPKPVRIDFDKLMQRMVALPLPAARLSRRWRPAARA